MIVFLGVRWVIGSLLLIIASVIIAFNAYCFWRGAILRKSAPSWIPLMGGVGGMLGLLLLPLAPRHACWFLPLLLDWGFLPGHLYTLWGWTRRKQAP